MDAPRNQWYFSDMNRQTLASRAYAEPTAHAIPAWHLYGEDSAFPDLLHIETITNRAAGLDWQIAVHRHPHLHQFFLVLDGLVDITLDGQTLQAQPPFLLNVPSGVVHGFAFSAGTSGWVLTVPLQTLPDLLDPAVTQKTALGIGQPTTATPEMVDLFHRIEAEHGATRPMRSVMLRALASQLGCLALRTLERSPQEGNGVIDPRVQQFLSLLDLHLRDRWRLGDYARDIGVSERHLSRICRAALGSSAAQIMESAVIREACRLLVYTRASVSSVGYSLGFDDPSYFSRAFRRAMGVSPAVYRSGFERDMR